MRQVPRASRPNAINNRDSVRVSTNVAYVEHSRGRNNAAIFAETHVDKVVFDGDRAVAVRVRIGGAWREVCGGVIILSAGAVYSPTILMRSGVGPADHLQPLDIAVRADLPAGRAFQDHPAIFLPVRLNDFAQPPKGFRPTNACVR